MPFFAYKGRNARGELLQGVLEGPDSNGVADQLFNTGVTPVHIEPTRNPNADKGEGLWARLTEKKVKPMDVQLFSRQLYTLLKAGVPIMRGLNGLQESAINKSFGKVVKDLRESLDAGRELSAEDEQKLRRYSKSIIIKGAKSPERLLDEVSLFLHQVISDLPAEQQKMIRKARHRDALLEGRRILVVEDDVRNVYALNNILEPRGAKVRRRAADAVMRLAFDSAHPMWQGARRSGRSPSWPRLPFHVVTEIFHPW